MQTYRSDILVIGGGLAGIVSALELIDHGCDVLLLDRDEEAAFGGLARESFGGLFFVGSREQRRSGIADSPAQALADWLSFAEFGPDDQMPRLWAERYIERCIPDVYEFVRRHGISFLPVPLWVERGDSRRGNSVPRFHMVWGTGRELATRLIAALLGHANARRVIRAFRHRVDRLVSEDGRVCGCAGLREFDDVPFEARAEHVIVATGGINGDIQRVKTNWHRDWNRPPDVILNGSHRYADGRVHDAVVVAGGTLTHLDNMWNYASGVHHWRPRKPLHGLSLVPSRSALWLNYRGERIAPPLISGFDTRALVTAICAQERPYSWQLLNRRIALKELAVSGAEFNPSIREKSWIGVLRDTLLGNRWLVREMTENCEDVLIAGSLPELVGKMNARQGDTSVDLACLTDAVARYDAAVDAPDFAGDLQLRRISELRQYRGDRLRLSKSQKILDHGAMPLIAIREFIISRKSLGGIKTDLQCRVLGADDGVIPGLFAVGEAAGFGGGGMHGLRGLEGTFLGGCILTGRMAGRAITGRPNV
ncbi:MAG TPA: FAD-binding dehydrogenase [Xanthobacteraceae bacterium]|nr:FAD-binding dehydrogenase [Xanthobacteraceae bacterium]